MDTSHIELPGSVVDRIDLAEGVLRIRFARAYIIKTMTGSVEATRWWQAGTLILEEAEAEGPIGQGPLTCDGGEIDENVYTYRDMIPIPFQSRGRIGCQFVFRDSEGPLIARGERVILEMLDVPKYIEHIRPRSEGI
ncbi:hypothetical protein ABC977_09920 [Thioalkalicoccus limnaeus]|uniref:ApaG domain-containing protein n=1 Tax=Thioalkalicoccus limnaeus TaxID=120681 RepID=A0ABV4BE37_9GAMM